MTPCWSCCNNCPGYYLIVIYFNVLLNLKATVFIFCVLKCHLFLDLFCLGERPEDPQDILQEVQEAPTSQGDPVQEGEGFPLCTG